MKTPTFDLNPYYYRIGTSPKTVNELLDPLHKIQHLMWQQISRIPFENTHVMNAEKVSLNPEDIINKIIHNKRGGYCYELNGLFSMVLTALKVPHDYVACRPLTYDTLRPKTHMAIIANIQQTPYLIDCAFGSLGPRAPIPITEKGIIYEQGPDKFRICDDENHTAILEVFNGERWAKQYGFNLHPQLFVDFEPANYFNANSPTTLFSQNLIAILFTEQGRKVLFNNTLKITENHQTHQSRIPDETINDVLEQEFLLPASSLKTPIKPMP